MVNHEDESPNYREMLGIVRNVNPGMPRSQSAALGKLSVFHSFIYIAKIFIPYSISISHSFPHIIKRNVRVPFTAQEYTLKTTESVRKWRGIHFWNSLESVVGLTRNESFSLREELATDPADSDKELAAKLAANRAIANRRMDQVCN